MKTKVNKIEIMNKLLHSNLTRILKNLNKRIHIKLYALVYDNKQTVQLWLDGFFMGFHTSALSVNAYDDYAY